METRDKLVPWLGKTRPKPDLLYLRCLPCVWVDDDEGAVAVVSFRGQICMFSYHAACLGKKAERWKWKQNTCDECDDVSAKCRNGKRWWGVQKLI